jgi:L-fucose isomerase-like protein
VTTTTVGLIIGNRGGFPDYLCESARTTMLQVLSEEDFGVVALDPQDTRFGAVETLDDAAKCGEMLKHHATEVDGIVVTLPNFGDEKAIANSIRFSGLKVPVLVHAFPDDMTRMGFTDRRDSFCGKISVSNNLAQYDIPFTPTSLHTVDPTSESFRLDLRQFAATCRVVRGLRHVRIGALGARPAAFNTVRYSEKILEHHGVSVETLDLSEALGQAGQLSDDDATVVAKQDAIKKYAEVGHVPASVINRMAKFGVVVDRWIANNRLHATTIQCWSAIQDYFGVFPCPLMSMMSNQLLPSACETDVNGALSMVALQLASGQPSMLLDWNNNFADDPDKAVVFHCSNLPACAMEGRPWMSCHPGVAKRLGEENAYGQLYGKIKPGPFTFLRISTDDLTGSISTYVGEGEFTPDKLDTYGTYGVVDIPGLQDLLYYICKNRFEHHFAATQTSVADAVNEALSTYLGWEVYFHA